MPADELAVRRPPVGLSRAERRDWMRDEAGRIAGAQDRSRRNPLSRTPPRGLGRAGRRAWRQTDKAARKDWMARERAKRGAGGPGALIVAGVLAVVLLARIFLFSSATPTVQSPSDEVPVSTVTPTFAAAAATPVGPQVRAAGLVHRGLPIHPGRPPIRPAGPLTAPDDIRRPRGRGEHRPHPTRRCLVLQQHHRHHGPRDRRPGRRLLQRRHHRRPRHPHPERSPHRRVTGRRVARRPAHRHCGLTWRSAGRYVPSGAAASPGGCGCCRPKRSSSASWSSSAGWPSSGRSVAAEPSSRGSACGTPGGPAVTGRPVAVAGNAPGLTAEQLHNAQAIAGVALGLGLGEQGVVIGIVTAITESTLVNINFGDFNSNGTMTTSRGLFQQIDAWGPLADRLDPVKAATMFYTGGQAGQRGLMQVPGWQQMTVAAASQAVQGSQFASGSNYQSNLAWAQSITTSLMAGQPAAPVTGPTTVVIAPLPAAPLPAGCGTTPAAGAPAGAVPVTPERPGRHHPQRPERHCSAPRLPVGHRVHRDRQRTRRRVRRPRHAVRVGRRRRRRRTEQRVRPRRRPAQLLRLHHRVRLLRPHRVRHRPGRIPVPWRELRCASPTGACGALGARRTR